MRSLGLRKKLVLGITALILLLGAAILLFIQAEIHNYVDHELQKRAGSIARHLAETAVTPILTENSVKLQLLVNDYKRNEEDIRYIYITDNHNQVIAHTFGNAFPQDLLRLKRVPEGRENQLHIQTEEGVLLESSAPIQAGRIGHVRVALSRAVIAQDMRAMATHILPYALATLALAILAALLFAGTITKPIQALAQGARMVGKGRLDWKMKVNTRDEIGEFAETFNWMTAELQRKITEQQRVEDKLHRQTALLEEEIAHRKRAQEELASKQQQLEALNESLEDRIVSALHELRQKDQLLIQQSRFIAMGEMISNIAHQWRQPLNNVALIIQNLESAFRREGLTEEVLTAEVAKAMRTICFMSQTIDDFRHFFGREKVKTDFSINGAVSKAIEFVSPALQENEINLLLEEEQGLVAFGYANEFSQVLLNIIGNAKDALLEQNVPEPQICIRLSRNNDRPVVTVADNGGGIPVAVLPKIYDPYFTTKDNSRGTGIGLYMSKIIIEHNMGGRLSAENVGNGAEFRIEF